MSLVILKNVEKKEKRRNLQADVEAVFADLTQQQWDEMEEYLTGDGLEGAVGDDWHMAVVLFRKADAKGRLNGAPSAKIKPRLRKTLTAHNIQLSHRGARIVGYLPRNESE